MEGNYFGYKELLVWQKSMKLVKLIYLATAKFPNDEKFGLISQMRRASVSIPSNIAEGKTRRTKNDYRNFLIIAAASGAELETQVLLSKEIGFGSIKDLDDIENRLIEIKKMLSSLISSLS